MTLAKSATKIGKLSTIYFVGSLLPQVINIIVLPIYTDYLSKEQMGVFNLASRVGAPLGILIQLGALAGFKSWYFRTDEALRPQLVRTMQVGQIAINLAMVALLAVIGLVWVDAILPGLPLSWAALYAMWLMILGDCFGDATSRLASSAARLREHAITSLVLSLSRYGVQTVVGLGLVFWMANAGMGEWQGFGRVAAALVASLVISLFAFRLNWRYGGGRFDPAMFKQTLRTSIKFVPHQLSDTLLQTANAWMVNGLFSTATLGVYGVGVGFAALIQLPLLNFGDAAYPTLSKLMREGGPDSKRQQARIYTLSLLMLVVAILVQQLFATVAIRVLTNPAYHEAAQVVPILIFAWLFQAFYAIVSQPVFYFGGGLWLSTATVSSIVVSVGVGIWTIPDYGMYGAAWSMAAGFAAKFVVAATASTYLYRLPWELTKISLGLACALLVAWVDWAYVDGWLDVVNAANQPGGFWQRVAWINLIAMVGAKLALLATIVPLWWTTGVLATKELVYGRDLVRGKLRAMRGSR